jgi:hypothetical protein
VTTPGIPHHDSDDDPTGIRHLLSSLPDPGPMPEELVERISASLREEQRRRESRYHDLVAGPPPAAGQHAQHDAVPTTAAAVVSLDQERARRRPTRALSLIGAAAAMAVAATVVTSQLFGGTAGDIGVSAQYGGDAGAREEFAPDSAGGAAGDDSAAEGTAGPAPTDPPGLLGGTPALVVVPGTFAATRDNFADEVRRELPAWQQHGVAAEGDGTARDGAALDAEDAVTCAESVAKELPSRAELVVTAAVLDGTPSVLLVQTRPGPAMAWVLPVSCARGPAELLHGPVVLD